MNDFLRRIKERQDAERAYRDRRHTRPRYVQTQAGVLLDAHGEPDNFPRSNFSPAQFLKKNRYAVSEEDRRNERAYNRAVEATILADETFVAWIEALRPDYYARRPTLAEIGGRE